MIFTDYRPLTEKQKIALGNMTSWLNFGCKDRRMLTKKEKEEINNLTVEEASKKIKKLIKKCNNTSFEDMEKAAYEDWLWKD